MKTIAILLATLLLAGCQQQSREPVSWECSVDDTIVFVAYGVTDIKAGDGMLSFASEDGRLIRRMQENETCREVSP